MGPGCRPVGEPATNLQQASSIALGCRSHPGTHSVTYTPITEHFEPAQRKEKMSALLNDVDLVDRTIAGQDSMQAITAGWRMTW